MIPLSSVCVGVGELASFLLTLFKVSRTPLDSLIRGFQTFPRAAGLSFPSCWSWWWGLEMEERQIILIHYPCNSSSEFPRAVLPSLAATSPMAGECLKWEQSEWRGVFSVKFTLDFKDSVKKWMKIFNNFLYWSYVEIRFCICCVNHYNWFHLFCFF